MPALEENPAVLMAGPEKDSPIAGVSQVRSSRRPRVTLITGDEPHYQLGLLSGLAEQGVQIDAIGGSSLQDAGVERQPGIVFKNLRGKWDPKATLPAKLAHVLGYYWKL